MEATFRARARSRWSSESLAPAARFSGWEEALCDSHLDWSLRRPREPRFVAEVEQIALGTARVVRCVCDPIRGARTTREVARSNVACFGIVLVLDGTETIASSAGELELRRGDFALWDSERELGFEVHERLTKVSLFVDKERLLRVIPDADRHVGRVVDGRAGPGALAASQLEALFRHAAALDAIAAEHVLEGTLELFGAAFGIGAQTLEGQGLRRVRAWIAARLDDAELTPERIAAAHGIAVRTLHAWFQAEGLSVSRWLLRERLARCRRDLARRDGTSVTAIAFRWGFNDVAYFSRAFKRAYGVPPSAFRGAP